MAGRGNNNLVKRRRIPVDKDNQLKQLSELIDSLSAELGQLKDQPTTRDEIIQQIVGLGALYRAIRTGDDLFLQVR